MLDKSHHIDLVDGEFSGTTRTDLATAFDALRASDTPDHLVVHFHGGLVGRQSAHETATEHLQGAIEAGGGYPLFVVWNSDLKTSLTANLLQILQDPVLHRLVKRILQAVLSKYAEKLTGGRGAEDDLQLGSLVAIPDDLETVEEYARMQTYGKQPEAEHASDERAVRAALEQDAELIAAERQAAGEPDSAARAVGGKRTPSIIDAALVTEIRSEHNAAPDGTRAGVVGTAIVLARYGYKIFSAVMKRLLAKRDHGVYTTIVEEIARTIYVDSLGAVVWSTIKNDTRDAFRNPDAGGSALVDEIGAWWQPGRRVTLIGHSTGAIYIGHILQDWVSKLPAEVQADVIFLAPACTFDFMYEYRNAFEAGARKVIVFGLSDGIESGYWEVPLYKGSLLYMVSGLLEPTEVDMPIVGMQRYYQGGPYSDHELVTVRDALIDEVVWAITGSGAPGGRASDANKHGNFEGDKMLASITALVDAGI